ncbi:hypothetical protein LK994_08140 [Ferruginibacter lapsinanis]|uniref:hypothetical protein n=1 Tax=Ferruginibacter lapsinanis TaxID=563172 RepID=UPI001E42FD79|nr:hypothetical protein [Ferruginibacter lapsinanis]UEG48605.1 hypothetical protein LK994_08140 [Ferruginibacter lapsinanis]
MGYLLFIFYLLLFCWLLGKIKFVVNAGLSKKIIVILFLTKVSAGLFAGWLYQFYPNADTWLYHSDALKEYQLLFINPKEYFTNLFISNYGDDYSGVFKSTGSYWNDLKTNLMVKMVSVFHILSGGRYYINVVIYNFLIFLGNIALFKVFKQVYKNHTNILVITCFLLPSFIFFGSTIHKEGLIIAALGTSIYCIYNTLHYSGLTFRWVFFIICSLGFIFLLRNFVFMAFIPGAIAWVIAEKTTFRPLVVFSVVYGLLIILFFTIGKVIPVLNLPQAVVEKQEAFKGLEKANTAVEMGTLHPTFRSFVANTPRAIVNSLLRPFITDGKLLRFLYLFAFEILLYELIFLVFLFFKRDDSMIFSNSFVVFGLFFSFSLLLMIGYTTSVLGAIVRYKSIYLPFIITPLLYYISWEKLVLTLRIKK